MESTRLLPQDKTDAKVPLQLVESSVNHADDEISKAYIEQLEMRRLGLPTSFGSFNKKRSKNKPKRGKQWQEPEQDDGAFCEADPTTGHDFLTDTDNRADSIAVRPIELLVQESTVYELTEQKVSLSAVCELIYPEEEMPLDSDEDGSVEERKTIRMTDNSFDYLQLEQLRITSDGQSSDADTGVTLDPSKRSHPEDEFTGSEVSKEEDMQPWPKKKKSRKSKNNNKNKNSNNPYYHQRFIFFSKYNQGIKLDRESWYSVTPEPIARHIATRIEGALLDRKPLGNVTQRNFFILDGFCGAGGNTIQFALMPSTSLVYAVDIDPHKIELARNNAQIYGCEKKIEFIVADFFEIIETDRVPLSLIDAVFLSPPWGGPDYNKFPKYSLKQMTPDGFEIARQVAAKVTKNISFLLPRNFDQTELQPLADIIYSDSDNYDGVKNVEIEKNLLNTKVKTMTAYFGELVLEKSSINSDLHVFSSGNTDCTTDDDWK